MPPFQSNWLMMSATSASTAATPACLEACPTGAIIRTEFDTVVVQQDICNGCGYCVPACPFGVVELRRADDGKAHKCTLCYDRLKGGLEPACAKSCPTDSHPVRRGRGAAGARREAGARSCTSAAWTAAYLYGTPEAPGATGGIGQLNAFFLLVDRPEVYNLPAAPTPAGGRASRRRLGSGLVAVAGLALAAFALLERRR